MLVLHRKLHQSVLIGPDIVIEVVALPDGGVRLGITAPKDVLILRDEVAERNGIHVASKKNSSGYRYDNSSERAKADRE